MWPLGDFLKDYLAILNTNKKKTQYNNNENSLSHGFLPRALNFNNFLKRILKTFANDVLKSRERAGGSQLVAPSALQSSHC